MRYLPLVLVALLGACQVTTHERGTPVEPTGSGGERRFAATDFTEVELAGADQVDVRVGAAFSVVAQGPADVLDRLRIARDGDTLSIGRKQNTSGSGVAHVIVTLPKLAEASVAGSGTMRVDRVAGGDFKGEIAGSGDLLIAAMQAEEAAFEVAGSGRVQASGTARRLELDIAGSGRFDSPGLVASGAKVEIAGSGDVRATVNGEAKVEIMGSGSVDLGAGARCKVEKMGSGNVRCGG